MNSFRHYLKFILMIISWMFFNTWNFLFELIPLQPFKSDKNQRFLEQVMFWDWCRKYGSKVNRDPCSKIVLTLHPWPYCCSGSLLVWLPPIWCDLEGNQTISLPTNLQMHGSKLHPKWVNLKNYTHLQMSVYKKML